MAYYRRFWEEFGRRVLRAWKGEAVGFIAATATTWLSWHYEVIPQSQVSAVFLSSVWPFATWLALVFLWGAVGTPVALDADREAREISLRKELKRLNRDLEALHAKPSALEQHRRAAVKEALDPLPKPALQRMREVWLGGSLGADELNSAGAPEGAKLLHSIAQTGQLLHREQLHNRRVVHRLNPEYQSAVTWYFTEQIGGQLEH